MSIQDFQDGHHGQVWAQSDLPFSSRRGLMIFKMATVAAILNIGKERLTILNLYIALMPHIKLQLNPTYGLGGDFVWRFSRWLTWQPSWISEWNDHNKFLCDPNASHQVWAQSDRIRGRYGFKTFKMAAQATILDRTILAILNLYAAQKLSIKFWLNPTYGLGGDVVWRLSRWPPWRPSWISEHRTNLAILNLYVAPMPPIKFRLHLTYGLVRDVVWRISRWRPFWISEQNDFSNSESLCHCDASDQVSAQSDLLFRRRCR